jgi:putative oxidoreductase
MKDFTTLVARILIAGIFLMAGIGKVMDPGGTQAYMIAHGMPLTLFFLLCAIAFELGGGLSVLLGFKARWGAVALVIFLIPTTLIFHTAFSERMQVIQFMKNSAIIGGLLMLASYGPGGLSIDALLARKKKE